MQKVTNLFGWLVALLALIVSSGTVRADVTENFNVSGALPATFAADGTWLFRNTASVAHSPNNCVQLRKTASLSYIGDGNGKDGGVGTVSFWHKRTATLDTAFTVEYSTDGGVTYTQIGTGTAGSSYALWTGDANIYKNDVLIRIKTTYGSTSYGIYVDDLSITDYAKPPYMANASLSEATHDFSLTAGAVTSDTVITVRNAGAPTTESLNIYAAGMTFTGTNASKFSVVGFSGATVAPGESTTMTLRYTPGNDGAVHKAVATLSCNDPASPSISVTGSNYKDVADLSAARAQAIGTRIRVTGTVTATVATNGLTIDRHRFFVQDASGADGQTGLMINDPDFHLGQAYLLGEQLQNLTGILATVDGMKALVPLETATDLGAGNAPTPLKLNGTESFAAIEGELVALSDVYFEESGKWTANQTISIVSAPTVLRQIHVGAGSGLVGQTIPDIMLPKHIVGIALMSNSTGQILPRLASDVTTGVAKNALISIDDSSAIDFGNGDITTGWKVGRRIQITNIGEGPLVWTGSGVSFTGANAAEFGVHPGPARIPVIWPLDSKTLVVYMDPSTPGTKTARMTLSTNAVNDPGIGIDLTGVGVQTAEVTTGWEQYCGGPEHRGRRYFNGSVTSLDAPVWQTGPQGLMASAAPCVIEDDASTIPVRVYCWGADHTSYDATSAFVKCFNGKTGALIWTSDEITTIGSSIGFDSWHSMAADKRSNCVFLGMGNHVYCFDADTGVMRWESDPLRVDSGGEGVVVNATCVVGKDYVYQTTYTGFGGTNYVEAFNISDGKEAWYYAGQGQGQETMVYREVGEDAYLYRTNVKGSYPTGGGGITCLNAKAGTVVWDNSAPLEGSPWYTEQSNFGGISYCDGEIYSPTYSFGGISELVCVDAVTGRLKWRATDSVASDAVPVVIADRVFITGHYDWGSGPSYVVGYDRTTGKKVYEVAVSDGNNMWNTSIAATNDMIYVTEGSNIYGMEANGLHILDPFREEELAEQGAEAERVRGSVAIGKDGSIYALMDTDPNSGLAHLVCYSTPQADTLVVEDQDASTTDGYTAHQEVNVIHSACWATEMRVWEDGQTAGAWVAYAATSPLTLSSVPGGKTIRAQYRNGSGEARPVSASIWLGAPAANSGAAVVRDLDGDIPIGQTNSRIVALDLATSGATEMMIWEEGSTGNWAPYANASRLTLSEGFGVKTIHVQFRNSALKSDILDLQIEVFPSPYAAEVVGFQGTLGSAPYNDPQALIGAPTRDFYDSWGAWSGGTTDRRVKLVEPAYNTDLNGNPVITTMKGGASITVKFDHHVMNDPGNSYGIDLLVFGNAFYVDDSFVNDSTNMNECKLMGGVFEEPVTVSVSQDGVTWYTFEGGPFADSSFPTNAYLWDATNAQWTDIPSDYTKPVNPALKATLEAGGMTAAHAIELYNGSGGGTGFDIGLLGLDWIQYVRVTSDGGEIDAVSDVRATDPYLQPSQGSLGFLESNGNGVDVTHGQTQTTMSLTLTNTGAAPLEFQGSGLWKGFGIEGDDFGIASITPDPASALPPGQSMTVVVRFAPQVSQRTLGLHGTLVITTNDPQHSEVRIPLTGDSVPVGLSSFCVE